MLPLTRPLALFRNERPSFLVIIQGGCAIFPGEVCGDEGNEDNGADEDDAGVCDYQGRKHGMGSPMSRSGNSKGGNGELENKSNNP